MAYGTTGAGTITKEQTLHSIRRIPIATATTITKGNVCELNSSGYLIKSPTTQTDNVQHFVALETVVNAGANGATEAPCAVTGHFVTVVADGAIQPGEQVKVSGSTAGQVVEASHGTDDKNLIVGVYWGKEGGTVSKNGSTPYLESFTDSADFVPVACADGDVIEVQLI